ncbi:MAG: hypothetical protein ACRECF_04440, partial [Methyloceanibacter sp.]
MSKKPDAAQPEAEDRLSDEPLPPPPEADTETPEVDAHAEKPAPEVQPQFVEPIPARDRDRRDEKMEDIVKS